MAPRCDALDGPVIQAAKKAIERINVLYVLPWVQHASEAELRDAFEDLMHAREKHPDAEKVADRWFFETVVRLHRMGEGEAFTGLKPDGADPGPASRLADAALESGDVEDLKDFFEDAIEDELKMRLARVTSTSGYEPWDIPAARLHIHETLEFFRFVERLSRALDGTDMLRIDGRERLKAVEATVKEKLFQLKLKPADAAARRAPARHAA
jgi:hypothetical protein